MEMITVTLTLIAVTIAVGVAAWMVALRRDNSRGRGVEQKESQGSMEPSASNDSLTQPARSHAPGAQDQLKPSEIETAVATSGSASLSQGDVGPAVKKHLPVEVQKETPQQASAESASSFTEAKPIDPEPAQKSELQGPGPAQEAEKLAQQTSSNREIISPSVEVADQVEQLAEADVVELTAKAVGEAGKVREDKRILPPQQRGGRPRETETEKSARESDRKQRPRAPKVEVICWKREREWILAVELSEELSQESGVILIQAEKPLAKDQSEEHCWRLVQLHGSIIVRTSGAETGNLFEITLGEEGYLVFKLSGGDQGRRVKRVSSGSCLVIVPIAWKRDEKKAGMAPVIPEPVSLDGYQAHFFNLVGSEDSKIAFRDDAGCEVVIAAGGPQFELVGQELSDASENLGPLFSGEPPRICVAGSSWGNVGTIVLGEEGSGTGRWRTAFRPDAPATEQQMPSELAKRKAGRYFARCYNKQDELVDSLDFRFASGLRRITIQPCQPLPVGIGHEVTERLFQTPELARWRDRIKRPTISGWATPFTKTSRRSSLSARASAGLRQRKSSRAKMYS